MRYSPSQSRGTAGVEGAAAVEAEVDHAPQPVAVQGEQLADAAGSSAAARRGSSWRSGALSLIYLVRFSRQGAHGPLILIARGGEVSTEFECFAFARRGAARFLPR